MPRTCRLKTAGRARPHQGDERLNSNLWKEGRKSSLVGSPSQIETLFSRRVSIASVIGREIREAEATIDAALYSVSSAPLLAALEQAARRGVRVRLLTDASKFKQSDGARNLLKLAHFPCRLLGGRAGGESKMHHKFLILDGAAVLTGSYNWTASSEDQHFENVVRISEPHTVQNYAAEFARLWREAGELADF